MERHSSVVLTANASAANYHGKGDVCQMTAPRLVKLSWYQRNTARIKSLTISRSGAET